VVRMVNWIIAQAVREGASDIHICPERTHVQLRFRVDGRLKDVPALPKTMLLPVVSRIKILAKMDISVSRSPQDGRFTIRIGSKEVNVRVSAIPTINGENVVLRLLDMSARVYKLDQLGMSADDVTKIDAFVQRPYGMLLSTGPTGSGKTTSLYSILSVLNQPETNIITVEDPVEYRIDRIRQLELNTKAGMTFASGLRSILRQDPDVIMVGEIRDGETASIAVQAALTGHRVLSTAHTNDAIGCITRLIDMGIEPFLISAVLTVSFAQRLVRRVCANCGKPYNPPRQVLEYWGERDGVPRFMRGEGCFLCRHTGYRGRTGIFEVLVVDESIQNLILGRAPNHEIVKVARASGRFVTLHEAAAEKAWQGITTLEEAAATVMV
jgi:type IV pilus assembly protein PilB